MFRSLYGKKINGILVVAGLACGVLLAGCGNNQTDTSMPAMPSGTQTQNKAAAGPAISDKLTFDQLALDSPVERVQAKNSPVYLHFKYTDKDGKVYKCVLPEGMSKGEFLPEEWVRTFNIYRLPEVIKQKAMPKGHTTVTGFPFVSPRPEESNSQQGGSQQQTAPAPMEPASPHKVNTGDFD